MRNKVLTFTSIFYFAFAIWLLFFFPFTNASRLNPSAPRFVNPIPFETTAKHFYNAWQYRNQTHIMELLANVGGNILLFIPMGVILYELFGGKKA